MHKIHELTHEQGITLFQKDINWTYIFLFVGENKAGKSLDQGLKVKDILYELQGKFFFKL